MRPEILTHPNIPKPLHGIAPRTVFGQEWWDIERRKCYENAGQKCEACGISRQDAWPDRWLEAHEEYYFHGTGEVEFMNLVCLCPACHKFIHSGLRSIHVSQGKLSWEMNVRIEEHGMRIIEDNLLTEEYEARHCWINELLAWSDFKMIIEDKEYGPSSTSYESWRRGEWRNWTPDK